MHIIFEATDKKDIFSHEVVIYLTDWILIDVKEVKYSVVKCKARQSRQLMYINEKQSFGNGHFHF